MEPDPFTWDDLRLVLAITETRALQPAADRLGVNASTAFRRLGALEQRVGLKLFERHRSGYVATPAGLDMTALATRMDEEAHALARRLAGQVPVAEGELRLATNDLLLTDLLTPILAGFRARHPAVQLEILVANEAMNLSRRDADVAIRATADPPETLVGRRLATIGWALYGRRQDGFAPGDGVDPTALADRDWVGLGGALDGVPAARFVRRHAPASRVACRISSVAGLAEAVEAGLGIGPLPCHTADRRPALVRLAPPDPDLAGSLWILTHPELRQAPRVRAFMDFVGDAISRQRAALAGEIEA